MNKEEYPELYKEYDKVKNPVSFEDLRCSSGDKVWWICSEYGHSYSGVLSNRVYKSYGCSICSGRKPLPNENDLPTLFPEIAAEWDYSKNTKDPSELLIGSTYKAWWICSAKGHSYCSQVRHRTTYECGCPFCSGNRVISGESDLATLFPDIAAEWDYSKNTKDPSNVSRASKYMAGWICPTYNHSYRTTVARRTLDGQGCPVCSGRRVLAGFNSLADSHPHLLQEWGVDNSKTPYEVSYGSSYRALWVCQKSHIWKSTVNTRTSKDSGCPLCSPKNPKVEELIRGALMGIKARIPVEGLNHSTCEVDCLLKGNIAVEYDGYFWHRERISSDTSKTKALINKGYSVIRVREQSNGNELPLLPAVPGLYQLKYIYDEKHPHLIPQLQDLISEVRRDRMASVNGENSD